MFSWLTLISRKDNGPLCSMFLCCLLRYILNFSAFSIERKSKNMPYTYLLYTTGLNWVKQFSNQIFSIWHLKPLLDLGPCEELISTLLHCLQYFWSKIKMIQTLSFIKAYEQNFLIAHQNVLGFNKDSPQKGQWCLEKECCWKLILHQN